MTQRLVNALNYLTDELRRSRRGNHEDYPGSDNGDSPMDGSQFERDDVGILPDEPECADHDHDGVCDAHEDGFDTHDDSHSGSHDDHSDDSCDSDDGGYDDDSGCDSHDDGNDN